MKSVPRAFGSMAALALAAAMLAAPALAAPTVYFDPASQTTPGGAVSVDIWVKDLTQSVGGVDITLNWNSAFLTGTSYTVDPQLVMGVALDPLNDGSGPIASGSLLLYFVADISFADEASLSASEGASFKLASITFNGYANGLSALTLSSASLYAFDGVSNLGATFDTGSICVSATGSCAAGTTIPEPTTALLVATALSGLALRRRQKLQA